MNEYIDFEYSGKRLSDFMSMIGSVDGGGSIESLESGNKLSMIDVETPYLKRMRNINSKYGEMLSREYTIIKNTCNGEPLDTYSMNECNAIMRWLNQPTYRKFKPIYSSEEWSEVYYNATFNVTPIVCGDEVIGFNLQMTTDAPFGYYPDVELSGTCPFTIEDTSDEIGYIYPHIEITAHSACAELRLINSKDPTHYTRINNVSANETITLDGTNQLIDTGLTPHSALYNDFNFQFPKIFNKMSEDGIDDRKNIYTVTNGESGAVNADIVIRYTPICKFGLL